MKRVDELDDWRRSHTSKEIRPELDGQEVTIFGWVASVRRQVDLVFIIIRDIEGMIQLTTRRKGASKGLLEKIDLLVEHASIGVRGRIKAFEKAPLGAEVLPSEMKILALPRLVPPFSIYGGKLPSIDKRLDIRAIDLRRAKAQSLLKIRHTTLAAIRKYFASQGYLEVNTPKIIATATEGGAALFPILYYDREAFLTQSPQLYKEELVIPLEKVFEIGPAFRAEQSRTLAHLSEFVSVDIERAYIDYNDAMDALEALTRFVIKALAKERGEQLAQLNIELKTKRSFIRYTYDQLIKLLREDGVKIEWGEDLSTPALRTLGKRLKSFYFITDWPTTSKPFYIKPKDSESNVSESFDFMHSDLEIASGGTRVSSKSLLVKRMKAQGLKPKGFEYHLKIFDYGMPPHAGFGLGLERFLAALTKEKNVREIAIFPCSKTTTSKRYRN